MTSPYEEEVLRLIRQTSQELKRAEDDFRSARGRFRLKSLEQKVRTLRLDLAELELRLDIYARTLQETRHPTRVHKEH